MPPPWAVDPTPKLFGYQAYVSTAYSAVRVLGAAREAQVLELDAVVVSDDGDDEGNEPMRAFVARALRLMATPGVVACQEVRLRAEAALVYAVRGILLVTTDNKDADFWGAEVRAAWEVLRRSGVLEARRIACEGVAELRSLRAARVASQAAEAERGKAPRRCALPECAAAEAHAAQFKRCAACNAAWYCCREHQASHWPAHKAECKAARKARAAAT